MRLSSLLLLAGLAACAATPSQSGSDPAAIRAQIDSLDSQFNRWINASQIDSIISGYYAPDAVLLQPGTPPARGADAIRAVYNGFTQMGIVHGQIKLTSISASDSLASDVGQYSFEIRDRSDSNKVLVTDRGNYLTTFVRRNGQWRALYDATLTEVPAAPAAAPAPAPASGKKK